MVVPTECGLGVFDVAFAIPEFVRCIHKICCIGKPGIQQLVSQLPHPFGVGLVGHFDLDYQVDRFHIGSFLNGCHFTTRPSSMAFCRRSSTVRGSTATPVPLVKAWTIGRRE